MTKKERLSIAQELRIAANRIETGSRSLCCAAIEDHEARSYFQDLFADDAQNLSDHDFLYWFQQKNETEYNSDARNRRVFGLLWAAHMAEMGVFE